ncbi:MAG: aminotransferase class V-fold PLP-dependent enzyme [Coriobacteriia bacterium]|nr:aminotransferase class V-fold PLP-dependent enzyme [Coriobacteriia bacterium]
MIYFDNAATTLHKPDCVMQAVVQAMTAFGGVGRGVHGASLAAGMAVFEAREALCQLLGAAGPDRVSFTSNVTESLNIALQGLLGPGDHVITTAASHNSVLRPLYLLEQRGVELTIVPVGPNGALDWEAYAQAFRSNTKLVAATHASNLTGDVYDVQRMAALAHEHGALVVVDAAQTAGVVPINMAEQRLDVVCFTGHKALYGPQGTGGLAVVPHVEIPPLKVGGSGTHSFDHEHPCAMPESLEAGTLNGHGISGLGAGVNFILETGVDVIAAHEQRLVEAFEAGVQGIPGVRVLGGGGCGRTGIVALNVGDEDAGRISDALNVEYGICTRAGAHCAPLMHEALGTATQGAVRFSFSYFNTEEEVRQAVQALQDIARCAGAPRPHKRKERT